MKILHIGGYHPVTNTIAKYQREEGHKIKLVGLSKPSCVFDVPPALAQIRAHLEKLKEESFDIIHIHRSECFNSINRSNDEMRNFLLNLKKAGSSLVYYNYGFDTTITEEESFTSLKDFQYLDCFDHIFTDNREDLTNKSLPTDRISWLPLALDLEDFGLESEVAEQFFFNLEIGAESSEIEVDIGGETAENAAQATPEKATLKQRNKPLKILHVPRGVVRQNSDFIVVSVGLLQADGLDFEFEILDQPTSNDYTKTQEAIKEADVVIEQVINNNFGLTAIQALALGKPVLSGNTEDKGEKNPENIAKCPIFHTDKDNLNSVINNLVKNKSIIEEIGKDSMDYIVKHHDSNIIGEKVIGVYKELRKQAL